MTIVGNNTLHNTILIKALERVESMMIYKTLIWIYFNKTIFVSCWIWLTWHLDVYIFAYNLHTWTILHYITRREITETKLCNILSRSIISDDLYNHRYLFSFIKKIYFPFTNLKTHELCGI